MSGSNTDLSRCVLLTGLPRSGSTLVCHLLNRIPNVVALHEPIRVYDLGKSVHPRGPVGDIEHFLSNSRTTLLTDGKAWSKHIGGSVPANPVPDSWKNNGALRRDGTSRDYISFPKPLSQDFLLAVKHNEAFTALLPKLTQSLPVFGIVRNPLAAIASWNTVDMKIRSGTAPVARLLDERLGAKVDAIPDMYDRQLFMLDWYFRQFTENLPSSHIIRYEDTIISGGTSLEVITPDARQLKHPMRSQNSDASYRDLMRSLAPRLLESEGAYWTHYSRESVLELLESELNDH